jgi:hypothetical protein
LARQRVFDQAIGPLSLLVIDFGPLPVLNELIFDEVIFDEVIFDEVIFDEVSDSRFGMYARNDL